MQLATRGIASVAVALALSLLPPPMAQPAELTARDVIARIQDSVGVAWSPETVDTFKAGDPSTTVKGIAVAMMATEAVLREAAASGHNLIITHEPTFYGHLDKPGDLEKVGDPVLASKRAFIEERHLVVWRFHDHWHARRPDGILTGVVRALGWESFQDASNPLRFVLPEATLQSLAEQLKQKLHAKVLRVVGDPSMKLTRVALLPGAPGSAPEIQALEAGDVQVLVVGETREWETVEYVADAVTQGRHKALVLLGHIPSEEAGMKECAAWLKTLVREVPVDFVETPEPFWTVP